ncbi:TetR/AcrR family transcriptional regulator [Caulobacter sp. KR2-114]|uniref:TetR/AcrR family transcriptional regulator n=1 Tax=Caulobacter sp. KR2-114 TaxID=3400912 RepID=UPI003C00D600
MDLDLRDGGPSPGVGLRRRTRLAPQARQGRILDHAAAIILTEGLAAATMERLARDEGVSKGLVYAYFPTRDAVFAALLRREQADLRDRGMASALRADTFADLIRQTTRLYLEQTRDRGALIAALLADPSVARLMEEDNRAERERTIRYFVRATRREFDLPLPLAIAAVDSLMNLTGGAGRQVADGLMDVESATEMCVALIVGGLRELSARRRPLPMPAARLP